MLKVIAKGRLTKDAEIKGNEENKFLTFILAVNGKKEGNDTTYLSCSMKLYSDKLASHLTKGVQILIDGEGYTRSFANKDGEAKQIFQVKVNDLTFLDSMKKKEEDVPENEQ